MKLDGKRIIIPHMSSTPVGVANPEHTIPRISYGAIEV